uniref:Uncharacterized protein n=1 Tax=Macrostomum lignano TaxID=282301 RepID=A0A1I8FJ29_9PLAT
MSPPRAPSVLRRSPASCCRAPRPLHLSVSKFKAAALCPRLSRAAPEPQNFRRFDWLRRCACSSRPRLATCFQLQPGQFNEQPVSVVTMANSRARAELAPWLEQWALRVVIDSATVCRVSRQDAPFSDNVSHDLFVVTMERFGTTCSGQPSRYSRPVQVLRRAFNASSNSSPRFYLLCWGLPSTRQLPPRFYFNGNRARGGHLDGDGGGRRVSATPISQCLHLEASRKFELLCAGQHLMFWPEHFECSRRQRVCAVLDSWCHARFEA